MHVDQETLDRLFDEIDVDGGGQIEYREIQQKLRTKATGYVSKFKRGPAAVRDPPPFAWAEFERLLPYRNDSESAARREQLP